VPPDRSLAAVPPFRIATSILLAVALFVAGVWVLPPVAALLVGGVLAFAGVVLFRNARWRTACLVLSSLLLGFAAAEGFFGVLAPPPVNRDVVKVSTPARWTISDEIVGYRPRPDTTVEVVATFDGQPVFTKTYTIDALGARRTPGSSEHGPTYLFVGDSYIFGEGLSDDETLPARFAAGLSSPAHVVNLGVLGYSPSHPLRAIETGQYDKYVRGKVAAVVIWITRLHLPRLTGDGGWLGSSPRYVLDAQGKPQFTGTFNEYRWGHPAAGIEYLSRKYLASVARAVGDRLEYEQVPLYVALLARLRDQVRERYGAPLVLICDWPEVKADGENDLQYVPHFKDLLALGVPMVSVRRILGPTSQWPNFHIPHDGHPNARLVSELARDLLAVVQK